MQKVKGKITSIRQKGFMNEGILATKDGKHIPFIIKDLPYTKNEVTLQGGFDANNVFHVEHVTLSDSLVDFLPKDKFDKHYRKIEKISKIIGKNSLDKVANNPEKLIELCGTNQTLANQIIRYIHYHYHLPNLRNRLAKYNINRKIVHQVFSELGPDVIDKITKNPYELAKIEAIPFSVVEKMGKEKKVPLNSKKRIMGAIHAVYARHLQSGNSFISQREFITRVAFALNYTVDKKRIEQLLSDFVEEKGNDVYVTKHGNIYNKTLFFNQGQIVDRLEALSQYITPVPKNLHDAIQRLVKNKEIPELDFSQIKAIELFFKHPLLIITGEAGTGKTTLVKSIIRVLQEYSTDITFKLTAPTGQASRRIAEATGLEAQTTHSLLGKGIKKNSRILYHHKKKPLQCDVLIVDETSMYNEYLLRDILWAVEDGTKIILIGDNNQLDPIGAGNPFTDLIEIGFPTVRLTKNYRNESGILQLAHAILNKEVTEEHLKLDGIRFIPTKSIQETKDVLLEVFKEKNTVGQFVQYPVVTMYRRDFSLGTDALNAFIKEHVNPCTSDIGIGLNDPVMQIENNKEKGVNNGDDGLVVGYDENKGLNIAFANGLTHQYTFDEVEEQIELAYCKTTHKVQGSQYEGVIIPIMPISMELKNRRSMWYRNAIYTAITRAKKEVIIIGDSKEFFDAINKDKPKRRTFLKDRIKSRFGEEKEKKLAPVVN